MDTEADSMLEQDTLGDIQSDSIAIKPDDPPESNDPGGVRQSVPGKWSDAGQKPESYQGTENPATDSSKQKANGAVTAEGETVAPSPATGGNFSNGTRSALEEEDDMLSLYHIKWINWGNDRDRTPIITQNQNGPCPLIAIFNFLLLSKKISLDRSDEIISTSQIMAHVADVIWDNMPKQLPEEERLNHEQNVSDAMSVFPNLQTGLDVNVKFSDVTSFEYTPELTVYDLLRIPLYHGWLIDPQDDQVHAVVGNLSYNQIVNKIISCKGSEDQRLVEEGLIAEQFLESTASQITCHGIVCLCEQMKPGDLAVLFRNNHFSTIHRHNNELFTLVTDLGFLRESNVVWETLSSVQGDSHFVDGHFLNSPPKSENAAPSTMSQNTDYDYQIALSLQQGQDSVPGPSIGYQPTPKHPSQSDYELAMQLQREEEMEVQRRQQQLSPSHPSASQSKSRALSECPRGQAAPAIGQRPLTAPQRSRGGQENGDSKCIIL